MCIYIYIYTHVCVCAYIYIYIYIYTCLHHYTHACGLLNPDSVMPGSRSPCRDPGLALRRAVPATRIVTHAGIATNLRSWRNTVEIVLFEM